jgi:hypothetical protein
VVITAIDHGDRIEIRVSARRQRRTGQRVRSGRQEPRGKRRTSRPERRTAPGDWVQLALW